MFPAVSAVGFVNVAAVVKIYVVFHGVFSLPVGLFSFAVRAAFRLVCLQYSTRSCAMSTPFGKVCRVAQKRVQTFVQNAH